MDLLSLTKEELRRFPLQDRIIPHEWKGSERICHQHLGGSREEANRVREEKAARKLEQKLATFHARKRRIEGYKSSNMEPMTVKKFKSRQGVNVQNRSISR